MARLDAALGCGRRTIFREAVPRYGCSLPSIAWHDDDN